MTKEKFKVVSLNFSKDRHQDMLNWLNEVSKDKEMSLSAFCISIIKEKFMEDANEKGINI